jgi:hypothetical protein
MVRDVRLESCCPFFGRTSRAIRGNFIFSNGIRIHTLPGGSPFGVGPLLSKVLSKVLPVGRAPLVRIRNVESGRIALVDWIIVAVAVEIVIAGRTRA